MLEKKVSWAIIFFPYWRCRLSVLWMVPINVHFWMVPINVHFWMVPINVHFWMVPISVHFWMVPINVHFWMVPISVHFWMVPINVHFWMVPINVHFWMVPINGHFWMVPINVHFWMVPINVVFEVFQVHYKEHWVNGFSSSFKEINLDPCLLTASQIMLLSKLFSTSFTRFQTKLFCPDFNQWLFKSNSHEVRRNPWVMLFTLVKTNLKLSITDYATIFIPNILLILKAW
jgi:hypothetical protein